MKNALSYLRWSAAYWISRLGACAGRYFPARFWYALAVPVAVACWALMWRQRRILTDNLTRVVGRDAAPAAARRVFLNFARYVIDFYQLPSLGREALCKRIDFHDWRQLNAAFGGGNGAIFVTLHLGQAELGAGALSAYGHPISAIAETFAHGPMNDFVQGLRRDLGMKVIQAKQAKLGVMRCLNRGELLGMMFDAVEPGEGVVVDFFGAPAEVSDAPARIALRTGARILPGVVGRAPHDARRLLPVIDFGFEYTPSGNEEADVRTLSQAIARSFEPLVRRFPDQWFAFRPVWAETPQVAHEARIDEPRPAMPAAAAAHAGD